MRRWRYSPHYIGLHRHLPPSLSLAERGTAAVTTSHPPPPGAAGEPKSALHPEALARTARPTPPNPLSCSSRSEIHHTVCFSLGTVLVHRSATSSSTVIDDSSRGARGFNAVSNIWSLAGDGAPSRDCSHRSISMSPPKVLSVESSPVTISTSTMPVLYLFSPCPSIYDGVYMEPCTCMIWWRSVI